MSAFLVQIYFYDIELQGRSVFKKFQYVARAAQSTVLKI